MFCVQCGGTLANAVRFCDVCGFPVVAEAQVGSQPQASFARPQPISSQITEEVRARSLDAWQGLQLLARNPVGGLSESFAMLGEHRAIQVGVLFAIVFEVVVYFGLYRLAGDAISMLGPMGGMIMGSRGPSGDITAAQMAKMLILGLVPFASLGAAVALARLVFRGKGQVSGDIYTAGASILPMGFFVLITSFLGVANIEVIAVLFLFALTYTVLMLYAGCSRIAGISEMGSAPAVPVVLLVCGWVTKVIVAAIW